MSAGTPATGLTDAEREHVADLVVRDCTHEGRTGRDWCCSTCHDLQARILAARTQPAPSGAERDRLAALLEAEFGWAVDAGWQATAASMLLKLSRPAPSGDEAALAEVERRIASRGRQWGKVTAGTVCNQMVGGLTEAARIVREVAALPPSAGPDTTEGGA